MLSSSWLAVGAIIVGRERAVGSSGDDRCEMRFMFSPKLDDDYSPKRARICRCYVRGRTLFSRSVEVKNYQNLPMANLPVPPNLKICPGQNVPTTRILAFFGLEAEWGG